MTSLAISRARRSVDQAPSWSVARGQLRNARPSSAGGNPGQRPTKLPAAAPLRPESQGGAGPSVANHSATRFRSWALSSQPTSLVLQLPKTLESTERGLWVQSR